jgi:hypothetical protein
MSTRSHAIRDGLVTGLIAAITVAMFYAVFDFLAARGVLYTVDLLGRAVFLGERDPSILLLPVKPDARLVLMYNALHLSIALAIGLVVVGLVRYAETHPPRARWVTAVIVGGFFVTIIAIAALTGSFRALLPWWSIVAANVLAVVCAGLYLTRRRPGVWHRLLHPMRAV